MSDLPSRPRTDLDRLVGSELPDLTLPSTAAAGRSPVTPPGVRWTVAFVHPKIGGADAAAADAWAPFRGCTAEACEFDGLRQAFARLGAGVVGIATQPLDHLRDASERLSLGVPLLSDNALELTTALDLPTHVVEHETVLERLTLVLVGRRVEAVFHPISDPARHPHDVLGWLSTRDQGGTTPAPTTDRRPSGAPSR